MTKQNESPDDPVQQAGKEAQVPDESTSAGVSVKSPEFTPLQARLVKGEGSMERFYDVRLPVWVELGRVELQLGELMQLGEGSVLRLNRPIGEPVDIVSQGVKLARGEVVVVDDTFAVRIREIVDAD